MKFLRAVLVSLSVAASVTASESLLADSVLETYAYDAVGRLTNRTDASGSWSFAYDSRDRLKTNTGPVGSLYYKYDVVGNLTNVMSSTPGGTSIDYQYDALNRLTNVVDHRLTGTRNTAYQYDAVGNLAALKYPNSVTNLWQYDARNRLTNVFWKLNTTTNASFAYRLGVEGNRTNLIANLNGWRTNAWGYDQLYRLTSEVIAGTTPTGTISYKYDVVGNRTNRSSTVAGITNHTLAYNTNDWLTIDSYDNNGNTTTSAGVAYQYDYANRLTNANNGGVIIVYNAAGDRISKKVGSTNTLYLVDDRNLTGYAQVLEELTVISGVTNLARAYTYGLDLISQRQPSVSTNFFGHDGLGSTRFLANSGGSLVNRFTYDAYGTLIESNGVPQTAYLFGGEQWDFDLGLIYRRARYDSPNTGRFWTRDTHEGNRNDPLSLHKYLFAHADPVNRIDPSGQMSFGEAITVTAISVNLYFAQQHVRQGQYGAAVIDIVGAGFGVYGLFGKLLPPAFSLASGGVAAVSAEATLVSKGISAIIAGTDLLTAMAQEAGTEHHIMTDKNEVSTAPDGTGPYTPKFRELLEGTGIDFSDAINKIRIVGHRGPHPAANEYTYRALLNATKNIPPRTKEYAEAIQKQLAKLAKEAATEGTPLNKMLTGY